MEEEEMQARVSVEWIETDELPFVPEQATEIFAVLEPIQQDEYTYYTPDYSSFYGNVIVPPYIPYVPAPEFEAPKAELLINIETTTANPWEGRIICIGVLDPNALEVETMNFLLETEEETLTEFLDWFEASQYTTFIGYNVSFDYRYIYVACQRYRKTAAKFMNTKLYDLMQQQKQVKAEFVFGYNKTGTLEEWATYLLGTQPYAEQKQVYKWLEEGNMDEIANFNSDKLIKSYFLWVLDLMVKGEIPGMEVLGRPSAPATETPLGASPGTSSSPDNQITVNCPNCLQVQQMDKKSKVINCFVCRRPIANPTL